MDSQLSIWQRVRLVTRQPFLPEGAGSRHVSSPMDPTTRPTGGTI